MDDDLLSRREFFNIFGYGLSILGSSCFFNSCAQAEVETISSNRQSALPETLQMTLKEIVDKKIHHGKDRFLNPFGSLQQKGFGKLIYWKLFDKNHFKNYYQHEKIIPVKKDNWLELKNHKGTSITFIKHSSILIKDVDTSFLIDPVLFDLFWIKDFSPLTFNLSEMVTVDHILITHGHYDHLDVKSLKFLGADKHVISPLGYDSVFEDVGAKHRTQLDWFESWSDGKREIILIPCNHWTMRNPFIGPNDSLWGSYIVKCKSGYTIFVSGDLAYFNRFKEIGDMFSIDLAVFNLGAYEPRWFMESSHINPEETVTAFSELKAKKLMIVHWGTFRLGDEPVNFPPMDIKKAMEQKGIQDSLVSLNHGETYFSD